MHVDLWDLGQRPNAEKRRVERDRVCPLVHLRGHGLDRRREQDPKVSVVPAKDGSMDENFNKLGGHNESDL